MMNCLEARVGEWKCGINGAGARGGWKGRACHQAALALERDVGAGGLAGIVVEAKGPRIDSPTRQSPKTDRQKNSQD